MPNVAAWEEGFAHLTSRMCRLNGSAHVAQKLSCTAEGYRRWASGSTANVCAYKKGQRCPPIASGDWKSPRTAGRGITLVATWEEGLRASCRVCARRKARRRNAGHLVIARRRGIRLGQAGCPPNSSKYKKDSAVRRSPSSRLEALKGWVWDANASGTVGRRLRDTSPRMSRLNGSARVPSAVIGPTDGLSTLGSWISDPTL